MADWVGWALLHCKVQEELQSELGLPHRVKSD